MKSPSHAALRRFFRSDWFLIPAMIVLLFGARSSFADHYRVPSGSMEYTIMTGDRVFVDKMAYGVRVPFTGIELTAGERPARGDIAIFDSPLNGDRLIKRIAAVAGDVVELHDGLLRINGELLTTQNAAIEHFGDSLATLNLSSGGGPRIDRFIVPAGYVIALGDHRGKSIDSRYFGVIAEDSIYGRAVGVYYRRGEGLTWHDL